MENGYVRNLYRAGSLETVVRKLPKYNLDLITVQEDRWDEGGSEPEDDFTFLFGNGNANHYLGTGSFVHKTIISAVKRVEFISDRMSKEVFGVILF